MVLNHIIKKGPINGTEKQAIDVCRSSSLHIMLIAQNFKVEHYIHEAVRKIWYEAPEPNG
jgi:hypothetical protein